MFSGKMWFSSNRSHGRRDFGLILHRFVILTAEIDIMMFGRNIKFTSFLYSIVLTFLFSFLVNLFMHFKLRKLDMVESMKSVE